MFQAHCISKAKFLDDDKIAYTLVYQKDMEKFYLKDEIKKYGVVGIEIRKMF